MRKHTLRYAASSHVALSANTAHQAAARHALRLFRSNAIYSFIPKNGCSTMRYSLALDNGCVESEVDIHWIHQNNETFRADLAALLTASYTFVILRCPYRRLASVFLDKIVGKDRVMWHLHDLTRREIEPDRLTFSTFVESLGRPAILQSDIHWRPQVEFLVYKNYDDVFQFEQFEIVSKQLKAKCDFDVVDARKLTRHGIDRYETLDISEDFSKVPLAEISALRAQGKSPSPRSLYSDELAASVSKLYRNDLTIYRDFFSDRDLMFA
jgi:hypothetical protein